MIAVIFEASAAEGRRGEDLDTAAALRPLLEGLDGFKRFESLTTPGKVLSLSFWRDEAAVAAWRENVTHRSAQSAGRNGVFADYRLRVAEVIRDYSLGDREQAPS